MGDRVLVAQRPCFSAQADTGRPGEEGLYPGGACSRPIPALGDNSRSPRSPGFLWPVLSPPVNSQSDLSQPRWDHAVPCCRPFRGTHSPQGYPQPPEPCGGPRVLLPGLVLPPLVGHRVPRALLSGPRVFKQPLAFAPQDLCTCGALCLEHLALPPSAPADRSLRTSQTRAPGRLLSLHHMLSVQSASAVCDERLNCG